MIKEILQALGLNQKEISFYLTLLPLGAVPASVVGNKMNIPHSTARYIGHSLVKKGLLTEIEKNGAYLFVPEAPEQIVYLFEKKKQKIADQQQKAVQIIPELKLMSNPASVLPVVKFWEGADSIEKAYNSIAEDIGPAEELLSFSKVLQDTQTYQQTWQSVLNFVDQMKSQKIRTRSLYIASEIASELKEYEADDYGETRLVNWSGFDFEGGELLIYRDIIWSISVESKILYTCRFQSKSLSQMYRALFEIAWEYSNPKA